jgi:hypothetical protein
MSENAAAFARVADSESPTRAQSSGRQSPSTKDLRRAAGLSITAAAALCQCAPQTYKFFELVGPDAIRDEKKRASCEAGRMKMAELASRSRSTTGATDEQAGA